ncbi:hypothetical protein THRCLA_06186 [Thraustotheca clavata]|uniref:Ubiquitin-like protease family profile domain-containing protein n=1 Tax=Thraustotheca clavata TaxID=74557 RepID=A0A1V9ZQ63_9STRA|nr:hypothetical protein THRCLA_06186 [Thraustotheca clavata]
MDGDESDIPAFKHGKRVLSDEFNQELDRIITPDKESTRKKAKGWGLKNNASTTILHEPYIPLTHEMWKESQQKSIEKKKERSWDNNSTLDFAASPLKRPFAMSKATKSPLRVSQTKTTSKIVPGQSLIKESNYSQKIATPLSNYALKAPISRLRVLRPPPPNSLKKTKKIVKDGDWRSKPSSKQPITKLFEQKRHRPSTIFTKQDLMDQRLVRKPLPMERDALPKVTPFPSKRPSGTADTPINLSSDEEIEIKVVPPPPPITSSSDESPTQLSLECFQVFVGDTQTTGNPIIVSNENNQLKWLSKTLPINNIAHLQGFFYATDQVPSCLILKLTKLNTFEPSPKPHVVFLADNAQDVEAFYHTLKRKYRRLTTSEITDVNQVATFLKELPGYESQKNSTIVSCLKSAFVHSPEPPTRPARRHRVPSVASKIILHYPLPPATNDIITITMEDLERLNPGTYLNDNLIDYYFKWLQSDIFAETKSYCLFMGALFFPALRKGFDRVSTWFTYDDIFSKELIVVPINMNLHWSLAIIFNPIEASKPPGERKSPTTIAFLDSLGKFHKKRLIFKFLTDYLGDLYATQGQGSFDRDSIAPVTKVQCPQQNNLYDCGVYMLLSAQTVVSAYASSRELLKSHIIDVNMADEMIEDQLDLAEPLAALISENSFDQIAVDATRVKMRENIEHDAILYQQIKATDPSLVEYQQCSSGEDTEDAMEIEEKITIIPRVNSPEDCDMGTDSTASCTMPLNPTLHTIQSSESPPSPVAVVVEDDDHKAEQINLDNPHSWSR